LYEENNFEACLDLVEDTNIVKYHYADFKYAHDQKIKEHNLIIKELRNRIIKLMQQNKERERRI